jgi:GNAT superfamily N-acetyltransferase
VEIRPRRQSDLDALIDMAELVKRLDGYPPRRPLDMERFISPPEQSAAWVAEIDGGVVGHAAYSTGANDTVHLAVRHTGMSPRDLAVVARVLVSPTARRIGVGHGLLGTAVHGAHHRGLQPILEVAVHFDAAINLYESADGAEWGRSRSDSVTSPAWIATSTSDPTRVEEQAAALTTR